MRFALTAVLIVTSLVMPASFAQAEEVNGPIRLVPEDPESWTRLDAKFVPRPDLCPARQPRNLHAGYPGAVEIGRRSDGKLYIVTELDFPRYLKGIAEVPRDWHLEALKAQVVAARTYGVSHMNPSTSIARELRYNLCATDACQVYRGRNIERGAWGDTWQRAVDETSGEILEYQGKPASTFYFSTSNGRTYSNSEVFGGGPLPYLKPVDETDDTGSPVSSWSVRIPLKDMTEALKRAGTWTDGTIESIRREGSTIYIAGSGASTTLTVDRFRSNLNSQAVCLVPKRYPTLGAGGRALPQVIPSKWLEVSQEDNDAVITGRGWGHGVGMVQWGLKGKADRGMNYSDMLAFYYGGLRPVRKGEPGQIRIGLAVDVEEVHLERVGRVRIEGANTNTIRLSLRGGTAVSVAEGPVIAPVLNLEKVAATPQAAPLSAVPITFELSGPANVWLRFKGPAEGETPPQPKDRSAQSLDWDVSAHPPGVYEVTVVADDGVDTVASDALSVTLAAPASPTPSPTPTRRASLPPQTRGPSAWLLVAAALGFVGLVTAGAILFLRRR